MSIQVLGSAGRSNEHAAIGRKSCLFHIKAGRKLKRYWPSDLKEVKVNKMSYSLMESCEPCVIEAIISQSNTWQIHFV